MLTGKQRGGLKTKEIVLARDPEYYKRIGALGGKKGKTGGFGAGEEGRARARMYGAIGGSISRRGTMK